MGGIEPRSGQGEGSRCEGSQQVDVERLERKSFTVEGSTRRSSTRLPRRTSAAGRTCIPRSVCCPKSSCASRTCWRIIPKRKDGSRNPATSPQKLVRRRSRRHNRLQSRTSRSTKQRKALAMTCWRGTKTRDTRRKRRCVKLRCENLTRARTRIFGSPSTVLSDMAA